MAIKQWKIQATHLYGIPLPSIIVKAHTRKKAIVIAEETYERKFGIKYPEIRQCEKIISES